MTLILLLEKRIVLKLINLLNEPKLKETNIN